MRSLRFMCVVLCLGCEATPPARDATTDTTTLDTAAIDALDATVADALDATRDALVVADARDNAVNCGA